MKSKLVSIIIPAYNAQDWIERCLVSCLNQSYQNIEIIVINDGSTDNTANILEKFNVNKLKIFHEKNSGVAIARRKGLDYSRGEYIFFLDSDDFINESALEILVTKIDNYNADVVIAQAKHLKKKSTFTSSFKIEIDPLYSFLNGSLPRTLWPLLFKRSVIEKNLIPSQYTVSEDYVIMSKIYTLPIKIVVVNDCLYNYVKHTGSVTANITPQKYNDHYKAHHYIEKQLFETLSDKYKISFIRNNLDFLYSLIIINSPYVSHQ
ncbi:TPA: glycosyltransferase family 2 protein, partial [Escherichia coli]